MAPILLSVTSDVRRNKPDVNVHESLADGEVAEIETTSLERFRLIDVIIAQNTDILGGTCPICDLNDRFIPHGLLQFCCMTYK